MTTEAQEMRAAAAKIARKRADGFHTGECDRGHTEWDTNAFVCSNRGDCLCIEREEEAEAIALAIEKLSLPLSQPDPDVEAMAKALDDPTEQEIEEFCDAIDKCKGVIRAEVAMHLLKQFLQGRRTALANYRARLPEQGAITRGSRVSANGRDYSFSGEIVASFYKRNGTSLRYVVEDDRGVLLIHSPRTVVAEQGADPARGGSDSLSVDDAEFGMCDAGKMRALSKKDAPK